MTKMMTICLAGLLGSAAFAAGPTPEALLPSHEARDAYTPAAASDGKVFLVAWQSGRLAEGDLRNGLVGVGDIVACRVDKSGKVLDAKPIVVSGAADLQERPMMAFGGAPGGGGGNFLIVWQDLRNEKDYDVYAARVTGDGKVLDADGILVSGGAHNQANPRVCWDGQNFFVVWQDFRSDRAYECYAARVSAAGKVLDPQGVLLVSDKKFQRHMPSAASAGKGKNFILWAGNSSSAKHIAGSLFFEGGKVTAGPGIGADGRNHGPGRRAFPISIAAGPASYLATWTTQTKISRGAYQGKSSAAIFGADGARKKNLFLAGKAHWVLAPEVAWDGSAFVAAWAEWIGDGRSKVPPHDQVFASRVSADGNPSALVHLSGDFASPAKEPAVATDGAGLALVAYEKHPSKGDVPVKIGFRMLRAK